MCCAMGHAGAVEPHRPCVVCIVCIACGVWRPRIWSSELVRPSSLQILASKSRGPISSSRS